jgi:hypothetical protein
MHLVIAERPCVQGRVGSQLSLRTACAPLIRARKGIAFRHCGSFPGQLRALEKKSLSALVFGGCMAIMDRVLTTSRLRAGACATVRTEREGRPEVFRIMRQNQKTSVLLAFFMFGCGTGVFAQGRGYYNRVTTSSREVTPERSARNSVARVGRVGAGPAAAARSNFRADSLHPYSEQAVEEAQTRRAGVPRGSTWEQEPVVTEVPSATVQPRSHNYFPSLRPGLAPQQPVTLTSTRFIGHMCTCGRAGALTGAGPRR